MPVASKPAVGFTWLRQSCPAAPGAEPAHHLHLSELVSAPALGSRQSAGGSGQPHSPDTAPASPGPTGCWGEPRADPHCCPRRLLMASLQTPCWQPAPRCARAAGPGVAQQAGLNPGTGSAATSPGRGMGPPQPCPCSAQGSWGAEPQLGSWSSPGWDSFGDLSKCLQPAQCPVPQVVVSCCTRQVAAPSWHAALVACFRARELRPFRACGKQLKSSLA